MGRIQRHDARLGRRAHAAHQRRGIPCQKPPENFFLNPSATSLGLFGLLRWVSAHAFVSAARRVARNRAKRQPGEPVLPGLPCAFFRRQARTLLFVKSVRRAKALTRQAHRRASYFAQISLPSPCRLMWACGPWGSVFTFAIKKALFASQRLGKSAFFFIKQSLLGPVARTANARVPEAAQQPFTRLSQSLRCFSSPAPHPSPSSQESPASRPACPRGCARQAAPPG